MAELNIPFADGNKLLYFNDDTSHYAGCPTCNFGSEYINDVSIQTTNHIIQVHFNQMYEYGFTTAEAIKLFAVNVREMTEDEFITYLLEALKEYVWQGLQYVNLDHKELPGYERKD